MPSGNRRHGLVLCPRGDAARVGGPNDAEV